MPWYCRKGEPDAVPATAGFSTLAPWGRLVLINSRTNDFEGVHQFGCDKLNGITMVPELKLAPIALDVGKYCW